MFVDRVEHAIAGRPRLKQTFAVLFLDLDDFKSVNDTLGDHAGDALIVEVARRLCGCLRPTDTIARLGGDEFAVLLRDTTDRSDACTAAERLAASLQAPMRILGRNVLASVSIGIVYSGDGDTVGDLLRHADIAMYAAKARGPGACNVFDPTVDAAA